MTPDAGRTQADDRLEPGVRVGSYLIERRLGSGGMGSVFAGRHIGLDKPVALKTLHPSLASREEQVLRFVREGRAASRIRHPHVVDVTDVGTHEGIPFLVMEYLEGEDLQTRLASCRVFTPAEIARIMLPVLDAVAAAHDKGVVHRDLKPSNVFLERGPHGVEVPKVLDFGIAKILDTGQVDRVTITRAATFLGTPYYASPEQAQSGKHADARSDQYSIGAMMYQLATGRVPVQGGTPFEVLCAIVAGQVTPIREARPDVLPELAAIVERAMAHDAADRFGSVRELGVALLPLAEPMVRAQWEPAFGGPAALTVPTAPPGASPPADPGHPAHPGDPSDLAFAPTVDSATSGVSGAPAPAVVERSGGRGGLILGAALAGLAFAGLAAGGAWWWTQQRPADGGSVAHARGPEAADTRATDPEGSVSGAEPGSAALDDADPEATNPEAASDPMPATATEPPSAEEAEPATPEVEILAEPAAATIEIDGEAAGVGSASLPRDGEPHEVRVTLDGYRPRRLRVEPDETPPERITLERREAPRRPTGVRPRVPAPRPQATTPRPQSPTPRPLGGPSTGGSSGWGRPQRSVGNNRAPILD